MTWNNESLSGKRSFDKNNLHYNKTEQPNHPLVVVVQVGKKGTIQYNTSDHTILFIQNEYHFCPNMKNVWLGWLAGRLYKNKFNPGHGIKMDLIKRITMRMRMMIELN